MEVVGLDELPEIQDCASELNLELLDLVVMRLDVLLLLVSHGASVTRARLDSAGCSGSCCPGAANGSGKSKVSSSNSYLIAGEQGRADPSSSAHGSPRFASVAMAGR